MKLEDFFIPDLTRGIRTKNQVDNDLMQVLAEVFLNNIERFS